MSNIIHLNGQQPPAFTDNDRLEHLYAAIAFLISHGKINPLAVSLRVAQLDGSEVDISLNEVMNQARGVIDKNYQQGAQLQRLLRYDIADKHCGVLTGMAAVDDGPYVLLKDVQRLLQGA